MHSASMYIYGFKNQGLSGCVVVDKISRGMKNVRLKK